MSDAAASSLADAFPLIRSGGLFLMAVGVAVVFGAANMRRRYVALGVGAAIGSVVTALSAVPLAAPFGAPSAFQVGSLAVAVAFEILTIAFLGRAIAKSGQRLQTIATLSIVGAHFVIMAPAFGPPIVALGLLAVGNAMLGLIQPRYPLSALWLLDGALKIGAGAAMFMGHLLPCWPAWSC